MANLSSKTGFSPIQTQVNFSAVNSATSVQDFAAYDAQELQGFVYVNTTSTGALTLRASVKVMVVKNGAGTYEVASVDISGDNVAGNPIVSFSMSGSVLRATLSSSITGTWGSGYIRYQLSAPYLGGNYPLSVTASQVLGGTSAPAAGYIGENKKATVLPGANQSLTTGYVAITGASLSLDAGVWFIFANVGYEGVSSPTPVSLELYDGAAQVTYNEYTMTGGGTISLGHVINTNSTKSYSLRTKATSALGGVSGFNRPQFIAVRIG